ncbi:MAG: hypothetical protein VW338_04990 [Rhodospirillaceae bacterium]
MTATIHRFPPIRMRAKCSQCGKRFIKQQAANDPAFCTYDCAKLAQPKHVASRLDGNWKSPLRA